MEWLTKWAEKVVACSEIEDAMKLLDTFLESTDVLDYIRDVFCGDCEERMPDEPSYNEGYL